MNCGGYDTLKGVFESQSVEELPFETQRIKPDGLLAQVALPCQTEPQWDYQEQCYSYYANGCYNTCQFVNFGDIEDFMNNEKRKEKSRDAARSRRSKETEYYKDLGSVLPVSQEQVLQLDKASIVRLAIAYLRVRDMINLSDFPATSSEIPADESMFLKSLDGFLLAISADGDVVYMSENVSDYLGITQIDLMGQNIYDYTHPCDHEEIKEILAAKSKSDTSDKATAKSFFIRFKCTLTSKGRSVNLKSATYKVIHCTGHVVQSKNDIESTSGCLNRCLVAIGQPIPHPSNIEAPLPRQTFLTKHGLDMKFTHADDQILMDILGYDADDLVGKSVYNYHHAMDSDAICASYKSLFAKGQCETNRYRFLAKTGGYVWVLTQATLINDGKKPQSVVCVNYVISEVECKDEIYSSVQLACSTTSATATTVPETSPKSSVKSEEVNNNNSHVPIALPAVPPKIHIEPESTEGILDKIEGEVQLDQQKERPPLTATSKIFAPRTEEMNKGFLTFSDEEPGLTMFKDEPEDLTHLAPEAGGVCIPLNDYPLLSDVMLDEFLLKDNFGPLLADEPTDPFISYRDSYDGSPQLLSPNLSKNSECSLPSLNSPSDSLSDEDRMSTFMNLQLDEDTDLIAKAPYIPMNMSDDLPLLRSDDLMWNNNNNDESRNKNADTNSSLAQLLCSSMNKHSRISPDHHGGGLVQTEQNLLENFYNKKNMLPASSTKTTSKMERSNKRCHATVYEGSAASKRSRNNEPLKEKMSSELLQQLISNNSNHRGRPKSKSNWLLDSGGQKAACISQPSDSVLMNLLDDPMLGTNERLCKSPEDFATIRRNTMRKNSLSLLVPNSTEIPSLLDLTQQDFEVNAPANNLLLHGHDILTALDINSPI